jgi:hypothetical protein|tara:strand:+ start:3032 stop:3397 length:366 start_codon:yes stop_codon:yes gene_type:complete
MTYSQIFKYDISLNIVYDFLDNICDVENNEYVLKNTSYKKGVLLNYIDPFCKKLEPYYYLSKKHYVTKKINYKSLATIIRQICKSTNINIKSKITYNKSTYEIIYYITKNQDDIIENQDNA